MMAKDRAKSRRLTAADRRQLDLANRAKVSRRLLFQFVEECAKLPAEDHGFEGPHVHCRAAHQGSKQGRGTHVPYGSPRASGRKRRGRHSGMDSSQGSRWCATYCMKPSRGRRSRQIPDGAVPPFVRFGGAPYVLGRGGRLPSSTVDLS